MRAAPRTLHLALLPASDTLMKASFALLSFATIFRPGFQGLSVPMGTVESREKVIPHFPSMVPQTLFCFLGPSKGPLSPGVYP